MKRFVQSAALCTSPPCRLLPTASPQGPSPAKNAVGMIRALSAARCRPLSLRSPPCPIVVRCPASLRAFPCAQVVTGPAKDTYNDFGQAERVNIQPLPASNYQICGRSLAVTLPSKSVVMLTLSP